MRIAVFVLCLLLAAGVLAQETTPPPTPEQLAAIERARPKVEAIWKEIRHPDPADDDRPRRFMEISEKLIAIGPDALPFLTSEIDLVDPATFHFSAYALGRLGGEDAEVALRKAVRGADARGGRLGLACKRFATYGLSLLGVPDVMDMMQSGGQTLNDAQVIPDLPVVANMALLVGPPGAALLDKQLEAYRDDPNALEKLENTVLALGYAGDASFVPKLAPLLSSKSPRIRVHAADAISRLAEPSFCEQLLPLLGSTNIQERNLIAGTFGRWKPAPCYKAMVGRLEVEEDIGIRAVLYGAIADMAGENALEILRVNLQTHNEFDQAAIIRTIGRIGSKKGLNILRSALASKDHLNVVRALESIAQIGGESAMDTLYAVAGDRRPAVAASAREILVKQGSRKVAPRVAEELLSNVREPVGNRSLVVPITEHAEALVNLGYTDPAEDLKKAAAIQSDPEVAKTLSSCALRLELLAKNGDDPAAWAPSAASADAPVRRLADRRLAEIGTPAAVKVLAARLSRTELTAEERADILMAIAQAKTAGAADLVERNLSDPAFDDWDLHDARAAAAWAARRLGGDRMIKALRDSAVRRDGRDWASLAYLAVLDKSAVPTLKTLRLRRLRYPESHFGREESLLEVTIDDLSAGRTAARLDVPPDTLFEM